MEKTRHSLAHILAMAAKEIDPDVKMAIGPTIDNGFYYDFEFSKEIGANDLPDIEKKMRTIINKGFTPEFSEISKDQAREIFKDQPYKLELIEGLEGKITTYTFNDFTDLCEGPHVESSKDIDPTAFKITHTAGAYWRGDEKNKMLTRIYGLAFSTKEELKDYIKKQEEAKERDHRKIGKEMNLWTFSDLVGSGLPLFTPKGTVLRTELYENLLKISKKYGMELVTIPHMAKRKLYEISGHADKFGDELLIVKSKFDEFILKPVNCPHHTQIYASEPRSYRDLPIRYMESTMQYRDEQPGEISGLNRVRAITVDDGHIFCRIDQVSDEAKNIANIIKEFYTSFDMWGNHWVSLSVRDPETPENYIGDEEDWEKSEKMLQEVSDELKLSAKRMEGEAALYGPKLDFMFTDALGKERQLATVQIDFAMPKRFGLEYTDKDGSKKTPIMIHRAILGSYERFLALIIEHYGGAFPLWLSPVQVKVVPIGEDQNVYADNILSSLRESAIRVEIDKSNETLGKKIRNAKKEKIPYVLVIGAKEVEEKTVTVEHRDGNLGAFSVEDLIKKLQEEINLKS